MEDWKVEEPLIYCRKCKEMEWISVKDKLPIDYEYVLVCNLKEGNEPSPISIARQYKGIWEMLNHSDQSNAIACGDLTWYMNESEIMYWIPIPKIPVKK